MQETSVIFDSDVYRLIANSTLPEAVEFERWSRWRGVVGGQGCLQSA